MAEVDYKQLSDTSLVMPNGQSLNVQRFTVNNQPWVIYPGKTPADGGSPLYVGTDGTNYQFYTYGPEDGYRLYQYHPALGSTEDEKNLSKSQEVHTRAYGNDKPKKQFGGTMNYASYLQGGGAAPQNAAPQVSKEDIAEIITAALNGTDEIKQQATAALQEMMQDASLAPLVEQVMSEMGISSQKCGGRVKKKALGSKLIKTQKAKCGCELKKVGGRLIEVDGCTGLPVHRNGGMVRKYQSAAGGPLTYTHNWSGNRFEYNPTTSSFRYSEIGTNPTWTSLDPKKIKDMKGGTQFLAYLYNSGISNIGNVVLDHDGNYSTTGSFDTGRYVYNRDRGTNLGYTYDKQSGYRQFGRDWSNAVDFNKLYKHASEDPELMRWLITHNNLGFKGSELNNGNTKSYWNQSTNSYMSNFGAADAQWDKTKGTWTREGYNYDPSKGWSAVEPEQPVVENPKKDPVKTWRDTFGAGKSGKFGGLTYDQALARQQEMLNAEWFNANLGTSGATKRGDDGMWGRTSQKEWDRYQSELQVRNAQAAETAAAEAEAAQIEQMRQSGPLSTVSGQKTNQELLGLSAGQAMSTLSRPDYERWMKLNSYQQGRNASLIYNGTRYDDENAYNAAVDAEIMRTAPQFNIQEVLNTRGKRKRNALYADYQTKMNKLVANNPVYKGPDALSQEQLSATSFKNGGKFNYKNYLQ